MLSLLSNDYTTIKIGSSAHGGSNDRFPTCRLFIHVSCGHVHTVAHEPLVFDR